MEPSEEMGVKDVGAEAENGAGGVGRCRGYLEKGVGSREGDAGWKAVEAGVVARSGGGGVGRGRVSRGWGAAGRAVGLLGMPAAAVVPPTPLWRGRIPLRAGCSVFRWFLLQIHFL